MTVTDSNKPELGKFDLGATWFWPHSERIIAKLAHDLNVNTLQQYTEGEMLSERFRNQPPEYFGLQHNPYTNSSRFAEGEKEREKLFQWNRSKKNYY